MAQPPAASRRLRARRPAYSRSRAPHRLPTIRRHCSRSAFDNTGTNPSTETRIIDVVVNDGTVASNLAHAIVEVTQVNNSAPTLDLDGNNYDAPRNVTARARRSPSNGSADRNHRRHGSADQHGAGGHHRYRQPRLQRRRHAHGRDQRRDRRRHRHDRDHCQSSERRPDQYRAGRAERRRGHHPADRRRLGGGHRQQTRSPPRCRSLTASSM